MVDQFLFHHLREMGLSPRAIRLIRKVFNQIKRNPFNEPMVIYTLASLYTEAGKEVYEEIMKETKNAFRS